MKNWSRLLIIGLILFLGLTKAIAIPFGSLNLPVQFIIENGDFVNSTVNVKKNGEVVSSVPGEKNMHLKLEYGNNYLLSFSKPGYITKKIEVNTEVAAEHGKQGFEPYKIGVRLFKQYTGVNIVIYNQPVAIIKYQASLDAFNYDVDYTKSILSELTITENILEVKAAEERAQQLTAAENSSDSNAENNSSEKAKLIMPPANSISQKTNPQITNSQSPTTATPQEETKKVTVDSGASKKPISNLAKGDDPHKLPNVNEGTDQLFSKPPIMGSDKPNEKISIQQNQDTVHFSDSKNINELPIVHFKRAKGAESNDGETKLEPEVKKEINSNSEKGVEIPNSLSHKQTGTEVSASAKIQNSTFNRTIEKKTEPNRVITTIRIINGDHTTEYRHIVYNWGGEYFFMNNSTALSPHLFDLYTGQ